MKTTLWELFYNAYDSACEIPWKVYGNKTHKLLCDDFRNLPDTPENAYFDDYVVVSHHRAKNFWKIYVDEMGV